MPKQMPSTGCVRFWITSTKPKRCKFNIATLAVPTPGKINLSAALILLRSLVISALYPNRSKSKFDGGEVSAFGVDDGDVSHLVS